MVCLPSRGAAEPAPRACLNGPRDHRQPHSATSANAPCPPVPVRRGQFGIEALSQGRQRGHLAIGSFDADERERLHDKRNLTTFRRDPRTGMYEARVTLDSASEAVFTAAINALSAPRTDPETGALDMRTPGARRADALLGMASRAAQADPIRLGGADAQLRRRHHPRRARHKKRSARPGPQRTVSHPRTHPAPRAPRQRLYLPGLHDAAGVDRRPPHHPLGRRRPYPPRQYGPAVPTSPHRRPPARPHRHRRRYGRALDPHQRHPHRQPAPPIARRTPPKHLSSGVPDARTIGVGNIVHT